MATQQDVVTNLQDQRVKKGKTIRNWQDLYDYDSFFMPLAENFVTYGSTPQSEIKFWIKPLMAREDQKAMRMIFDYEPLPNGIQNTTTAVNPLIYPDTVAGLFTVTQLMYNDKDVLESGRQNDFIGVFLNEMDIAGDVQNNRALSIGGGYFQSRIERDEQDSGTSFNIVRSDQNIAYDRLFQKRYQNARRHYNFNGDVVTKRKVIGGVRDPNDKFSRYIVPMASINVLWALMVNKFVNMARFRNGVKMYLAPIPANLSHVILTPWTAPTSKRNRSAADDFRVANFGLLRRIAFYNEAQQMEIIKKIKTSRFSLFTVNYAIFDKAISSFQHEQKVELARTNIRTIILTHHLASPTIAASSTIVNDFNDTSNGLLPAIPYNTNFFAPNIDFVSYNINSGAQIPANQYHLQGSIGIGAQLQQDMLNQLFGGEERVSAITQSDTQYYRFLHNLPLNNLNTSQIGSASINIKINYSSVQPTTQAGVAMDLTKLVCRATVFYDEWIEVSPDGVMVTV